MIDLSTLRNSPKNGFKVQQGDVIIRLTNLGQKDLEGMSKTDTNVVVPSSNPHVVRGGTIYKHGDTVFIDVPKKATFHHREHKDFKTKVGPGVYFAEPIVEVDFLSDMIRPVVD